MKTLTTNVSQFFQKVTTPTKKSESKVCPPGKVTCSKHDLCNGHVQSYSTPCLYCELDRASELYELAADKIKMYRTLSTQLQKKLSFMERKESMTETQVTTSESNLGNISSTILTETCDEENYYGDEDICQIGDQQSGENWKVIMNSDDEIIREERKQLPEFQIYAKRSTNHSKNTQSLVQRMSSTLLHRMRKVRKRTKSTNK